METLTLENICPYLPYGLKAKTDELISDVMGANISGAGILYINGRYKIPGKEHPDDIFEFWHRFNHVNPILRPMNLTTPIQVDGKEIIPLEVIGKMINSDYQHLDTDKYGNAIIGYDEHNSCGCPFDCNCGDYNNSYVLFYKPETKNFYSTIYMDADPNNMVGQETHESYEAIQWLYANKFDVFGLIEKGLAIDVNTLDVNPYNT